jgi:hypothetical protein
MTPRLCGAVNLPERVFQKGRLDTVEIAHAFLNSESFAIIFERMGIVVPKKRLAESITEMRTWSDCS